MTETGCFCASWMNDGPHLSQDLPTRVAIWGAEPKWGTFFCVGSSPRGLFFYRNKGACEVKPSAGPNMV
jgi:hypothetical protein